MAISFPTISKPISRRRFLKAGFGGAAALALYSGEVERHWLDITRHEVALPGLSAAFDGMKIAQLTDIHFENFTEPFFLRHAIAEINRFQPDAVFLTGDFITADSLTPKIAPHSLWKCATLLATLECRSLYAILGNHDMFFGAKKVIFALSEHGITVLRNSNLPLERPGGRIWLAGVEDPFAGHPNLDLAIPAAIREVPNEPVILLCHGPDFADRLMAHPAGRSVSWMLSGHTHGGQVRIPFLGPLILPPMGRKYVEGWFRFDQMQLYVNRGLGALGVPFRFCCPPELAFFTLRAQTQS